MSKNDDWVETTIEISEDVIELTVDLFKIGIEIASSLGRIIEIIKK